MTRRTLFQTVASPALAAPLAMAARGKRPNFIVLLADDLGYGDVNLQAPGVEAFRNPHIQTPHLAALAKQSLVMTDHYAASTVCSPSRAGLLTGRTPTRANIDLWINDLRDNDRMFLSGKEVTVAEQLRRAGYATAIFGKWHLNGADWEVPANWTGWTGSFPAQQGFTHGMVTKENPHAGRDLQLNSQETPGDYFSLEGKPAGPLPGFSSQIITDAAIEWMKQRKDEPFFLYLPFDAVHEIITSPAPFSGMYQTGNPDKDKYYANVSFLDAQVGRLMAALDAQGLSENTVVLFTSDNGPDVWRCNELTARSYGTSYPLAGHKRQLFEGGIRVPGMVRWTGRIRPGVSRVPNSTIDLMPTLCDLAGVAPPAGVELDGVSLKPHWLGRKRVARRKPLYWHFEKQARQWATVGDGYNRRQDGQKAVKDPVPHVAIRRDDYALRGYKSGKPFALPERYELYDVVRDPGEKQELSRVKPEVFRRMVRDLEAMHSSVMQDRAKRAGEIEQRKDQRASE
jgi:arylsulfatase A